MEYQVEDDSALPFTIYDYTQCMEATSLFYWYANLFHAYSSSDDNCDAKLLDGPCISVQGYLCHVHTASKTVVNVWISCKCIDVAHGHTLASCRYGAPYDRLARVFEAQAISQALNTTVTADQVVGVSAEEATGISAAM